MAIVCRPENQIEMGIFTPIDMWDHVAGYLEIQELCEVLDPALPDTEKSKVFKILVQGSQAGWDRNLLIFWSAISYSTQDDRPGDVGSTGTRLAEVVASRPAYLSAEDLTFATTYIDSRSIALCPNTAESAARVRSLLNNPGLQEAVFNRIAHIDYRRYRTGIHTQPMTLVVPELSLLRNVYWLNFGNTEQFVRRPVDLRSLTNLERVDLRYSRLRVEDLQVGQRVWVINEECGNNEYKRAKPAILPPLFSFSAYLTRELTEYRGSGSALLARIGFELCYLGLMVASAVETLVRGILTAPGFLFGVLLREIDCGDDALDFLMDMTLNGAHASAVNTLACGSALYSNLATDEAIRYEHL
ncbi:MAG: hypothetical protein HYX48_00810 [Chlamydiales bacterium]|nr:hypothetical protein [Chlamydiales bacterium]